ncbi:unnamed protein product, partial [Closterium sp. Yama58-4]
VGGQVDFHGMPGGSSTPAWTKLTATAQPNDLVITVQDDVSAWPLDAFVVVTSTDYFPDQAEVVGIIDVVALPSGGSKIFLEKPLRLMHFGDPKGIPDGWGGFVDQRAEVALLNRTIAITGTDEPAPYHREGGHFMIFMSSTQQFIEGVEFAQMGQQGKLGRYNIHFHVCGDDGGRSVVRKNVMHDSKQRCVVVHTTFNLTVEENVAYHTRGHCFMVEEGGETGNTFLRNLGIWTRAVEVLIPLSSDPTKTEETDDNPSTFWITNPNNNLIGNVAAGSENSGYWMELRDRVRGFTLSYPGLNATVPANGPFGIYRDNVAHSNRGPGWRTYPKGVRPRQTWSLDSPIPQWQWKPSTGTISGLLLYKQSGDGLFVHNSDGLIITNSTFADNRQGVNLLGNTGVKVADSRFIGVTPNYGNPRMCDSTPQMCGPVTGCDFPLAPGQQGRSQGWSHWKNPIFGIIIDQPTFGFDFARAHAISNCRFHAFDSTCRLAAAIGTGINGAPKDTWATATSVQAVTGTPGTNMLYFPPRNFTFPGGDVNMGGEATDLYTLWDKDGSLLNSSSGGYLLANNTALLAPTKRFPACQPVSSWNAYACPCTCYRTVMFSYLEPGFTVYDNSSVPDIRKRGDFSYLSIRRIEDDTVITVDGNLRSFGNMWAAGQRIFVVPLLANATYEVNIGLPSNNRAFFPSNITVQVRDSNGCGGPVTLRIPAKQSNQWMINEEQDVNWKTCAGTSDKAAVQFSFVCFKFKPTVELSFDGTSSKPIVLRASPDPVTGCRLPYRCGLIAPGSTWAYDVSGRELHAAISGAMGFSSPRFNDASWPRGPAIIGYAGWRWGGINTWTPPSGDALPTFYYRRPFRVANSACATGLYVDVIVNDGVLLYLNGVEMLRVNMAPGAVNVSSRALSNKDLWDYTSFFIPLNATAPFSLAEGTNHIAAESHAAIWTTENFFDLKLSAQMDSATCSGVLILQEVCDGLDNNNDGKIDIDPLTDRPLTRPCRNPCGAGIETCIDGAYQNCTAPVHGPEVCNGVDDNCDGLIDNSASPTTPQLDCANGSLCFKGQCLPYGPLTTPVTVVNKSAAGWLYYDKGYLPQSYPTWSTNSNVPARLLKEGAAPFGYNSASPTATNLSQLTSGDSAYFFLKSFALTEEDVNNTWSYSASVQRDDGAVLLMNGAEFFRTNMPAGPVTSATFAVTGTWGADKTTFFNSTPFRSIAQFLQALPPAGNAVSAGNAISAGGAFRVQQMKVLDLDFPSIGANALRAHLHQSCWSSDALLDLQLTPHAKRPCSLPSCGACSASHPIPSNQPGTNWVGVQLHQSRWSRDALMDLEITRRAMLPCSLPSRPTPSLPALSAVPPIPHQPGTNWVGVQLHQSRWSRDALMDLEITRRAMLPCSLPSRPTPSLPALSAVPPIPHQPGTNWVGVQLHQSRWSRDALMDLEITRRAMLPCSLPSRPTPSLPALSAVPPIPHQPGTNWVGVQLHQSRWSRDALMDLEITRRAMLPCSLPSRPTPSLPALSAVPPIPHQPGTNWVGVQLHQSRWSRDALMDLEITRRAMLPCSLPSRPTPSLPALSAVPPIPHQPGTNWVGVQLHQSRWSRDALMDLEITRRAMLPCSLPSRPTPSLPALSAVPPIPHQPGTNWVGVQLHQSRWSRDALMDLEITRRAMLPCSLPSRPTPSLPALSAVPPIPHQPGTNWVGVQLHQSRWSSDALFDIELTRHAMRPCSALDGSPSACVRTPPADTLLLAQGSTWAYNDASQPPPNPDTWFLPSFDDSAWPRGPAPLAAGNSRAGTNLTLNSTTSGTRVAHYFRRTFTVTDAACHVALTVSFNIADGAVVYLNGVEAYRFQMPPPSWGPVTPATTATNGYVWRWVPSVLSGGWLQQGANVIAVEVHQQKSTNTLLTFDVQVTSKREAVACTPAPQ